MSNYLTTDGLKIFSLLPEAPLRPEARGICHMVNPALIERGFVVSFVSLPFALVRVAFSVKKQWRGLWRWLYLGGCACGDGVGR